jgi:hypothetical protein
MQKNKVKVKRKNSTMRRDQISVFLKKIAGVLIGLWIFSAVQATTYYSGGSLAPNNVNNWWTNTNGTGSHPANFTSAGDIFTIQNSHSMTTSANWTVTGTVQVNSGGTITATGNDIVDVGTIIVDGTYQNNSSKALSVTTLTVNGTFNNNNSKGLNATTITVNGTFNDYVSGQISGTMTIRTGGIYDMKDNTANPSIATATWNTGSTCIVSGMTSAVSIGGDAQSFYNFTWSSANTRSITFTPTAVNGNFTVSNCAAGGDLSLAVVSLDVMGNLSVSGANTSLVLCGNTSSTVSVRGNVSVTAGTLNLSKGSGTCTFNIYGNFSHTGGTITETGSASGSVVFCKTGTQTYTSGGTLSNTINYIVNSGSILQMGTGASPAVISSGSGGTFTLSAGATLGITSTAGITTSGATGNIQLAGIRTFESGANYIYNGTADQSCGDGLTQNRPNNIEISNSGRTISLQGALISTGYLKLTAGTFNLNGNTADVGDIQGSGTITSGVALAVSLTVGSDNSSTTFSGIIQNGTGPVSFIKNGTGTLTLANTNTFTGGVTINAGTVKMGATNALTTASPFTLNGGTINTGVTGYSNTTSGILNLAQNTTIALGSGLHSITFAKSTSGSWAAGAVLTITGWTGGYNSTSGTAGKIYFGSNGSGLDVGQLTKIQFQNGSNYHKATILSTGEVVPTSATFSLCNLRYTSPNTFLQSTAIPPLTPTITGTPTSYSVSPALPTGLSLNTSTGVITGTPTASTATATYVVTASDGSNTTAFGIVITVHVPTTYYVKRSGYWYDLNTWSTQDGRNTSPAATTIPSTGDIIYIGDVLANNDRSVTISPGTQYLCATLYIGGNAYNNSLVLADSACSFAISGNVTITASTASGKVSALLVNKGTGSLGGNLNLIGQGNNKGISRLTITSGSLSISGNLAFDNQTANTALIDMTGGAGTIYLRGAFTIGTSGKLSAGTLSNFNFNGISGQTIPLTDPDIVYNNILTNNTAGASLNAAITTGNVTGNLSVQSGSLNNGGFSIALNGTKTFSVSNGASFYLTSTSTMVSGAASRTFGPTSFTYYGGTSQTVSNENYGNLYLGGTGTKTLTTGATIQSDLYLYGSAAVTAGGNIITYGSLTISSGTAFTSGTNSHTIGGNFLNSGGFTSTGSTFTFNGSLPQNIGGTALTRFNDLVFNSNDARLTSSISARNLTINPGASVTTGSYNDTVTGNFTNDGTFIGTGGTVTFNGTSAQTIGGSLNTTFQNMVISNAAGVALNSSKYTTTNNLTINNGSIFTISPLGKLEVQSTLSNLAGTSGFVVKADGTGSGSLIHSTAGVNASVQHYLTDNSATYYYHTNSSPVSNAVSATYLVTGAGPYLYYYDASSSSSKWINITAINYPLTPGKGFLINYKTQTSPETITYSGLLNTGSFDLPLIAAGDGNNLVGNPYPCAIDWDAVSGWTLGNMDDYITIWNPADGSYGSYIRGMGTGTHGVTNIIPSGQGFFVHAIGNTTLSMTNSVKVHDNSIIKSSKVRPDYFKLRITNDTNSFNDEAVVLFQEDATPAYDPGFEARKILSMMKESSQIYTTTEDGADLSINALPKDNADSIVLFFKCKMSAKYTIQLVENRNIDFVTLTDLFTGNSEDLLKNGYTFTGSPTDTSLRFIINLKKSSNTANRELSEGKREILIYPTNNGVHLRNTGSQSISGYLEISNLLGQIIHREKLTLITDASRFGFETGIYIVKFGTEDSVTVKKIFIH